jgi:hypothetical protein
MTYLPQYLDWLSSEYGDMELMSQLRHEHKAFARAIGSNVKTLRLLHEVKEGRKLSTATKKSIQMARDHGQKAMEHMKSADDIFDALFSDEADADSDNVEDTDLDDDTSEGKAAAKTKPEPVIDHSAAEEILAKTRSLIPKR